MAGTRPLNIEQQAALATVLESAPPRDRAIAVFLSNSGLRVSEACSLTVGDVCDGGRLRARVRIPRRRFKGGRGCWRRSVSGRVVALNSAVARVLTEYLFGRFGSAGPVDPNVPLFPSRQGTGPVSRWQVNRIVHGLFAAAGVEDAGVPGMYGTHSLRKVYAARVYANSGHSLLVLKAALGHQSVATSEGYINIGDEEVERVVLSLSEPVDELAKRSLSHLARAPAIAVPEPKNG
jgi:integrase/recombinase XerD